MATLDPQLRAMMAQTVFIAATTGVTANGDRLYGTPQPALARVEPSNKLMVNAQGEDVIAAFVIYTQAPCGSFDHIWLPGADPSVAAEGRMAKHVDTAIDEDGTAVFREVYV